MRSCIKSDICTVAETQTPQAQFSTYISSTCNICLQKLPSIWIIWSYVAMIWCWMVRRKRVWRSSPIQHQTIWEIQIRRNCHLSVLSFFVRASIQYILVLTLESVCLSCVLFIVDCVAAIALVQVQATLFQITSGIYWYPVWQRMRTIAVHCNTIPEATAALETGFGPVVLRVEHSSIYWSSCQGTGWPTNSCNQPPTSCQAPKKDETVQKKHFTAHIFSLSNWIKFSEIISHHIK